MNELRLEMTTVLQRESIPVWLKVTAILLGIVFFPVTLAVLSITGIWWVVSRLKKSIPTPPPSVETGKLRLEFDPFPEDDALDRIWAEATWEGHSRLYLLRPNQEIAGLDHLTTSGFSRKVSGGVLLQMVRFSGSNPDADLYFIDAESLTARPMIRTGAYYLYNDPEDPEAITGLSPEGEIRIEVIPPSNP